MRKVLSHLLRLAVLPLFTMALFFLSGSLTAQSTPETWMDFSKTPAISAGNIQNDDNYDALFRSHYSVFNDLECETQEVAFAAQDYVTGSMPVEGCWFLTSIGLLEKGGYGFRPNGWEVGGYINSFNSQLFPTKHPEHFIEYGLRINEGSKLTIRRTDRFVDDTQVTPADTGWPFPVFLEWIRPDTGLTLQYQDGTPWEVTDNMLYSQMWYSDNGNFLAIWHNDGYFVLIDFETLTVKTISAGASGYANLAISDNGRYVAVNVFGNRGIRLIDTEACTGTGPEFISEPATCTSRVFADEFMEMGAYEAYGQLPVFYGDDLLGFYIGHDDGYREYVLRAPNTRSGTNYIALGDSYTSGEGAYHYINGTDEPNNRCHLSRLSYPYLLGDFINLDSIHSVACSGARMKNIAGGHASEAPQNKKFPNDLSLGKWIPGYKWQLDHVKDGSNSVDVVSIGIGGNDVGFSDKVKKCLAPGECFDSTKERYEIAVEISNQFEKLVSTYRPLRMNALKKSAGAKVYAIGYPQVINMHGNCGNNVRLTSAETELANNLIIHLNDVIEKAAIKSGIVYVSIEEALLNHRLCDETDKSAVNGLGLGKDIPFSGIGFFENESYHPTSFGHLLITEFIREQTSDFKKPLPFPNKEITAPDPLKSLLVRNSPDMTAELRKLLYGEEIINNVIFKEEEQLVYAEGAYYQLKTNSSYSAYFSSTPTYIGNFETDSIGNLRIGFTVPRSLEPGIHTLHIYGKNTLEEEIDIYKTVYIAASKDDWDGDGTLNDKELCGIFEPIHIDSDSDGLDDGCDSIIENLSSRKKEENLRATDTRNNLNAEKDIRSNSKNTTDGDVISFLTQHNKKSTAQTAREDVTQTPANFKDVIFVIMIVSAVLIGKNYKKIYKADD